MIQYNTTQHNIRYIHTFIHASMHPPIRGWVDGWMHGCMHCIHTDRQTYISFLLAVRLPGLWTDWEDVSHHLPGAEKTAEGSIVEKSGV